MISEATEVIKPSVVEEVAENATPDIDKDIAEEAKETEESNEDTNSFIAEKAFNCAICERMFTTENGLKLHKGKMHKTSSWSPIPQIDGFEDENYVEYAFKSDYGEEDIEDSLIKIQEKTNASAILVSRVRNGALSAIHDCVVQIGPVPTDTFTWPELDENDTVVFSELVKL